MSAANIITPPLPPAPELLHTMLETIPYPAYVVEADTFRTVYANAATWLQDSDKSRDAPCYQLFFKSDAPCDWCPVLEYRKTLRGNCQMGHIYHPLRKSWFTAHGQIFSGAEGTNLCFITAVPMTPQALGEEGHVHLTPPANSASSVLTFRKFLDKSTGLFEEAQNARAKVAVMSLHVVGLEHINIMYGYMQGDEVLKNVMDRVCAALPEGAALTRLRGSNFGAIFPLSRDNLTPTLDQLNARLRLTMHEYERTSKYATCRVQAGICWYPDHGLSLNTLSRRARHSAEAAPRTADAFNCAVFDDSVSQLQGQDQLKEELQDALHKDQLVLYFQPKYEAGSATLFGVEALIRWNHPKRGLLGPNLFIPLAEEAYLAPEIDNWVINKSCQMWREIITAHGTSVTMAINVSPQKFYQPDFLERMLRASSRHGIPPSLIEVELTEGSAMRDLEQAVRIMRQLRSHGFHMAMDDFGTGYSSFSYLRALPFDTIKLDRSFITDSGPRTRAMLTSLVSLLKLYGTSVVIEGVETQEQYDFSCRAGCDLVQGYFFDRPMPMDKLDSLLHKAKGSKGKLLHHLMRRAK